MPNLLYSLYCQKHLYGKLEVADFKYDNSFSLKLQSIKTPKSPFLVPKIRVFDFARNYAF